MRLVNGVKCRLLPDPETIQKHQQVAFFSDTLNIREHDGNEAASCKTMQWFDVNKNPGATAIATGVKDVVVSVCSLGKHILVLAALAIQFGTGSHAPFEMMGVSE